MASREQGKALFGRIALFRIYCPVCDEKSLTADPAQCPEGHPVDTPRTESRESAAQYVRKAPSVERQQTLLAEQENRCIWCEREFGSWVVKNSGNIRPIELMPRWDHFVPYSYTGSCEDLDFVAACQVCNGIKSNLVFDSEDDCRAYVGREARRRYESA